MDAISRVVSQSKQDWVLTAERWDVDDLPRRPQGSLASSSRRPSGQEVRQHVKEHGQLHT